MKKKKVLIILGILLVIALIATIANCSGDDTDTEGSTPPPTGNTTSNGTASTWSVCEEKDEFGLATGKKYLTTTVNGTFSDYMSKDAKLKAEVHATADGVSIFLWEHGISQLESLSDDTVFFKITVLDPNNNKHQYEAALFDGKPYLWILPYEYLDIEPATNLLKLLEEPGTVSFYIVNKNDKDNTYSFSVKTDGFADLYKQILPQEETTE